MNALIDMTHNRPVSQYVIAYVLWAISTAIGILIMNLIRETVLLSMVVTSNQATPDLYQSLRVGAVYQWSWLFIGIGAIILLVYFEHLYRTGVGLGHLWRRFFLATGIELAVLLLTHIIFFALQASFSAVGVLAILILVVEALLAGLFFWLWHVRRKSPDLISL